MFSEGKKKLMKILHGKQKDGFIVIKSYKRLIATSTPLFLFWCHEENAAFHFCGKISHILQFSNPYKLLLTLILVREFSQFWPKEIHSTCQIHINSPLF